ncbi:MAG: hybrid sensor histidine kinase/response regulator transcription factor [Marinifilaceae bacterium]
MTRLLFILILCLSCLIGHGADHRFRHITVDDGLNSNTIRKIFQDKTGYVWLGTNEGLMRIAGNKVELMTASNDEVINGVWAISEGVDGTIWIGSKGDLFKYNPLTAKISACGLPLLKGTVVNSCYEDKTGIVWIATHGKGIWSYTPGKGTKSYLKEGFHGIVSLLLDKNSDVWTITDNGIWKYNREADTFVEVRTSSKDKITQSNLCMYIDSANNLWIGGRNGQLLQYSIDKKQIKNYNLKERFAGIRFVRCILEVELGIYYIGTNDGMVTLNTHSNSFELLKHHPNNPLGLNDNFIHALHNDREGGVWLGTYFGGINYLSPERPGFTTFDNVAPHSESIAKHLIVGRFAQGANGELYIGTDNNGVWRYNPTNGQLSKLPVMGNGTELNVHALTCDTNTLWIGTFENGIIKYNLLTNQWVNYMPRQSLNLLFRDSYGYLWAGGLNGALFKFDMQTNSFQKVHALVTSNSISDAAEDKYGNLWFATYGSGLLQYNRETGTFTTHRDSIAHHDKSLRAVCYYKNKLWVGTSGYGLCHWDEVSQQLVPVEDMKLPVSIYFIAGHKDKLWLTTNRGLCSYSLSSGKIAYYGEEDGLLSNHFNPNAGLKSKDNKIYVGGSKGVSVVHPSAISDIENTLPLVFTDFRMYNNVIIPDSTSIIGKDINHVDHVTLTHSQNAPGFDFVVLTNASHKKISYRYRLKGYNEQWQQLLGFNVTPSVSYMNLDPGEYEFQVCAFNQAGNPISVMRTLPFTILKPWWATVGMRIVYGVLVIAFIAMAAFFVYRKISLKHKARYNKIKDDANKKLLEAKIRMFQDITHEIRTPVTLISGPVAEVLRNPSLPQTLREDINLIKKNSDHLVNLMDQVLDFSKFETEYMHLRNSRIEIYGYTLMLADRFKGTARLKQLEVITNIPTSPCNVQLDVNAYDKVVSNILSNAIKYARNSIVISMPVIDEGTNMLTLTISDDGEGIADAQKIFDLFYRSDTGMTQQNKGFGIGLTIVKLLVDKMKGEIAVHSSPNGGASFCVKLPFISCTEHAAVSAEKISENVSDGKITLLLAEDNEDLRLFMARYLKRHYRVIAVEDGEAALSQLRQTAVDIVISDIMMPHMDGLTLCDHIKHDIETNHIPVILLTAVTDVKQKIKGLECGADIYVEKPVTMEVLHAQIENLIKQRRKLQQRYAEFQQEESVTQETQTPEELFIEKIRTMILENLSDADFTVDHLSKELGIGRTATFVKIKAITGYTPNDYIRMHRLHRAAEMLKRPGDYRINEICYLVGFSTPSYFSKCFQQRYGMLPSEMAKMAAESVKTQG